LARLGWLALAIGGPAVVASAALDARAAGAAATQDWPPFVLVSGLLLIGIVARDEGLFDLAGALIARIGRSGASLLVCTAALVALVTVTLNLDTSVTFLTPVVLAAARRNRRDPEPFVYLVVCMANAGSLLLPGSNLTNLIVLHETQTSGTSFVTHVATAWLASVVAVVAVVAVLYRVRIKKADGIEPVAHRPARFGPGVFGVGAAVVAMLALPGDDAALVVVGIGSVLAVCDLTARRQNATQLARHLNVPLLLGLFGAASALGTLGRVWSGPAHLLGHSGSWQTAAIGASASVVVNNLPAASLLAARPLAHAPALLVGLNLGPNLALSGSLAGVLWFQTSRAAGWTPSIRRFTTVGLVVVPVTMAASLGALALAH
jgi:arsenical pump membrane protein